MVETHFGQRDDAHRLQPRRRRERARRRLRALRLATGDGHLLVGAPAAVLGALLEDYALHEQEEALVDPMRTDLGQFAQREDLPHHPQVLHLVPGGVQDLGRELVVDRLYDLRRPPVQLGLEALVVGVRALLGFLPGLQLADDGGDVRRSRNQFRRERESLDEQDQVCLEQSALLLRQPGHGGKEHAKDLKQSIKSNSLRRVDGALKVVHDKVRVLQRQVDGDEREQQPCVVVVLRAHVGLEHAKDARLEQAVFGPGATCSAQVLCRF